MHFRRCLKGSGPILLTVVLFLFYALPATAGSFVRFEDGRYLEVKSYRFHPQALELQIGVGMKIVLPLSAAVLIETDGEKIAMLPPLQIPNLTQETVAPDHARIRAAEEVPHRSPH
jgi:hypothetical protein